MTLTRCKECNGQVSDQAYSCPHCGIVLNLANGELAVYILKRLRRSRIIISIVTVINFMFQLIYTQYRYEGMVITLLGVIGIIILSIRIAHRTENIQDDDIR